jgi:anti-sigma factor RsiW
LNVSRVRRPRTRAPVGLHAGGLLRPKISNVVPVDAAAEARGRLVVVKIVLTFLAEAAAPAICTTR